MSEDQAASELTKLRDDIERRFNEAEERQKARDPNIISAIRTLVEDIAAYISQKRTDFPREALIGVFGAYLRPRLVLMFGSIIATMIAAGEFWLIYRQNQIIERQTRIMSDQKILMEDQARVARAEVVSALLPALRTKESLYSDQSALVAAYGRVAIEALIPVVTQGLHPVDVPLDHDLSRYVWLNAARIVANGSHWMDESEAENVLIGLIRGTTLLGMYTIHSNLNLNVIELRNGPTLSTVAYASSDLQSAILSVNRFTTNRAPRISFPRLNWYQKAAVLKGIAKLYAISSAIRFKDGTGSRIIEDFGPALQDLCNPPLEIPNLGDDVSASTPYWPDLELQSGLKKLAQNAPTTKLLVAVEALIYHSCLSEESLADVLEANHYEALRRALPYEEHAKLDRIESDDGRSILTFTPLDDPW